MDARLTTRVERLEARRAPPGRRVRYAWWNPGEPKAEAAAGERLVVVSWADHPGAQDPAAPAPAAQAPGPGR